MVRLTAHARDRLAERGILLAWVEAAVIDPDWTQPDVEAGLTHSFKAIDRFGGRILKVVHRRVATDILVVTCYFDRSARP